MGDSCDIIGPEPGGNGADRPRAVVVDDHPLLQLGLKAVLEQLGLAVTLAPLGPTAELADWVVAQRPAVAVVDLGLPVEGGGLALVTALRGRGVRIVVLTGEARGALWAGCVVAGAEVVLSKSEPLDVVADVIRQVSRGEAVRIQQRAALASEGRRLAAEQQQRLAPFRDLSRRETEVLAALLSGLGPAEIAERDFVSVQTVRTQVKALLRKLGVRSQLEAVARARAAGWSPPQAAHLG